MHIGIRSMCTNPHPLKPKTEEVMASEAQSIFLNFLFKKLKFQVGPTKNLLNRKIRGITLKKYVRKNFFFKNLF